MEQLDYQPAAPQYARIARGARTVPISTVFIALGPGMSSEHE
jgi:hypothetical protein